MNPENEVPENRTVDMHIDFLIKHVRHKARFVPKNGATFRGKTLSPEVIKELRHLLAVELWELRHHPPYRTSDELWRLGNRHFARQDQFSQIVLGNIEQEE